MSKRRIFGTMAAMGGITAAVALLAGVPSAKADELTDLRANNELLQQKLDQLAQTGNLGPGQRVFSTEVQASGPAAGGSFPKSFLIPGTDTSIRINGTIRMVFDYYFEGGPPNNSPWNTTVGDNGQVQAIPLTGPTSARGSGIFGMSPRESKFGVETRTPTPYGEARTFMEYDWTEAGNFVPAGGVTAVSDNLAPRLRFAYGTLGGWLVGQANSNFEDADANAETIDFGGNVGEPGVVRIPQIRYTMPLGWGFGGALSFSAEAPETDAETPAGQIFSDSPSATLPTGQGLPGQLGGICNGAATQPANCSATVLQLNPTKTPTPDFTAAFYVPQPWGHFDLSGVLRPDLELQDGRFLTRTFVGYGGHVGFDLKPGWFSPKDDLTFHISGGKGIGRYLNSSTNFSIETNFLTATASPAAAAAVIAKLTNEVGGEIGYQHWWSDTVRSNISYGINHHYDLSAAIIGAAQAAAVNQQLQTAHANILWNPVSFVTIGLEYFWGERTVVANPGLPNHAQMQGLISKFEVAF